MRDDLIERWQRLKERIEPLGGSFDTASLDLEVGGIDDRLADSEVWNDPEQAAELNRRRSQLIAKRERGDRLRGLLDDVEALVELAGEGESVDADVEESLDQLDVAVADLEIQMMLSGPDDHRNAIISIHPGAGGVDAQDWAEMLLRMFERWAESNGYKVELVDRQDGEGAGIKSATCRVVGEAAYGWLKSERGVHRLVRISPFDAQSRRHTAFASIDVIPEVDDDIKVEIEDKELKIDTFRASGAGGQHVNVTDSAVRIRHVPSGIVVTCQDERSQHRNRDKAMRILKARLHEQRVREQEEKRLAAAGTKLDIDFGSQIRSYVLAPYRMVKDHRTDFDVGDVDRVLDGDLTPFMKRWLIQEGGA
ncbi:MAG: peptide chain release factor 2 [Acidobacteriota bacterium]|nr:peptide chain release factor 2 [Acidobacteriota bacterium]